MRDGDKYYVEGMKGAARNSKVNSLRANVPIGDRCGGKKK